MPKSTVAAIITKIENNVKYIMLIRRNTEPYKNYWALPGGHVKQFEKSEHAVIREVKEEIGLNFVPKFVSYYDEILPEINVHAIVNIFEGTAIGEIKLSAEEVLEAKWVTILQAKSMKLGFFHNIFLENYLDKMSDEQRTEILAEYSALRNEILKRMEIRHQLLTFTLIVAGTMLSLGLKESSTLILLLYPVLALFLAITWSQSDIRTGEIGEYIRTNIESLLKGISWQSYIRKCKISEKKNILQKATQISAHGIFLFTEMLALILAVTKFKFSVQENFLLIIDIIAIILTTYFIKRRRSKKSVGY